MTREIAGFTVSSYSIDTIIVQRLVQPHHEYRFRLTAKGVELLETMPAAVADGDPLEDANHFEDEATAAAKKYHGLLFPAAAE
jgi:hypothetical protein